MINIKLSYYNDEEVTELFKLLKQAENTFIRDNCNGQHCEKCKHRHLCLDLEKARSHMRQAKELLEP